MDIMRVKVYGQFTIIIAGNTRYLVVGRLMMEMSKTWIDNHAPDHTEDETSLAFVLCTRHAGH